MVEMYNYRTKNYEYVEGLPDESRLKEFIPQTPAAQILYDLCVEMIRKTPIQAMTVVLDAYIGSKPNDPA